MNLKSKALLAYVAIFLLGGASGFFLNEAVRSGLAGEDFQRGRGMNSEGPFFRNGEVPPRVRDFFINRLDLQDDQIEPFFDIQSEHLQEMFQEVRGHREDELEMLRQLYSDFIDDVDEVLTEEQVNELNSFAHPDSVHQKRMQRQMQRGRR